MTWLNVERLLNAQSDLRTVETAIEHAKKTLHYLESQRNHIQRELRHLEYRNEIERETNVKVVTGDDNFWEKQRHAQANGAIKSNGLAV